MKRFIVVLVIVLEVHLTAGSNITLFMTRDSEVCPGELVTLRCILHSPDKKLLWICPEGGASGERSVFCNSGNNIRDLECNQEIFSVSVLPCNDSDDFIVSDATYNATIETGRLTCAHFTNVSTNSSLQFGARAPSSPVLNWMEESDASQNVTIHWNLSFDNITNYSIFITPPPPQCSDPCVYRTHRASLSIYLQVGVEYSLTGQAERCDGALSSNKSAVLHVTLPRSMQEESSGGIVSGVVIGAIVLIAIVILIIISVFWYLRRKEYNQKNISWKGCIRSAPHSILKGSVADSDNRAYFTTIKSNKVFCYDAAKNKWSTITCKERLKFSVVVIGQYGLTVVGGSHENTPLNTLLCYRNEEWQGIDELPPMNSGREYPVVVATDACVVVASGKDQASVEMLSFGSGIHQWTYVSRLPKIPLYSIGTVYSGMVFIMDWDGVYFTCSLDELKSTQQDNKIWSQNTYFDCKGMQVEHATPVTINNRLFLVGGHTGSYRKVLNVINELEYKKEDDSWIPHPFATMPMHRFTVEPL